MSNPAGGLLLLLISIFLLVQFFAGNLNWLFDLKAAVDVAQAGATQPVAAPPPPVGPAPNQLSLMQRPVA